MKLDSDIVIQKEELKQIITETKKTKTKKIMEAENLLAWDIHHVDDIINNVGSDTLNATAQQIHENELSEYKIGMLDGQLVIYREKRENESEGDNDLIANSFTPMSYNEDSYVPPTVPTEPIFE